MMRRLLRWFALLGLGAAVGSAGGLAWVFSWAERPGPLDKPENLVLARGAGTGGLTQQLAAARIVSNPLAFRVLARLTRGDGELKAGEYAFSAHMTPNGVLALIRSGKTVVHRLVVPEGTTSQAVVALLEGAGGLEGHVAIVPPDGTLLPETYFYSWGDLRSALLARMEAGMTREVTSLWAQRATDLPISSSGEAVTLASIVEKETAIDSERPKIAGVFYNRLKLGMRFQSDPTVIYALTAGRDPLGRPLCHTDLATNSPYNTYLIKGLPPGPIGNPGRAALQAVLHPTQTDALYFVADGSGGHAFAASLEAHNHNVTNWRRIETADGRAKTEN